MVGAKLVMPGAALDGKSLCELFEGEEVTFSAGVPTVWLGVLQYLKENSRRFSTLKRVLVGGSACPPAMIKTFEEEYGVEVLHGWGMTEMSPVGTVAQLKAKHRGAARPPSGSRVKAKQGRACSSASISRSSTPRARELPWDGKAFGDLMVQGPWIASRLFQGAGDRRCSDGWFPTGDVATIDPDGYIQITDRSKDVIKSGGEWISSIELENIAIAPSGRRRGGGDRRRITRNGTSGRCSSCSKPRGAQVTREELLAFYAGKVAKWWVPDDVVFVETLPHTATGKLLKTELRRDFAAYRLLGRLRAAPPAGAPARGSRRAPRELIICGCADDGRIDAGVLVGAWCCRPAHPRLPAPRRCASAPRRSASCSDLGLAAHLGLGQRHDLVGDDALGLDRAAGRRVVARRGQAAARRGRRAG